VTRAFEIAPFHNQAVLKSPHHRRETLYRGIESKLKVARVLGRKIGVRTGMEGGTFLKLSTDG